MLHGSKLPPSGSQHGVSSKVLETSISSPSSLISFVANGTVPDVRPGATSGRPSGYQVSLNRWHETVNSCSASARRAARGVNRRAGSAGRRAGAAARRRGGAARRRAAARARAACGGRRRGSTRDGAARLRHLHRGLARDGDHLGEADLLGVVIIDVVLAALAPQVVRQNRRVFERELDERDVLGDGAGAAELAIAKHEVERRLLLDVVVGERAAVLELLARDCEGVWRGSPGRAGTGAAGGARRTGEALRRAGPPCPGSWPHGEIVSVPSRPKSPSYP